MLWDILEYSTSITAVVRRSIAKREMNPPLLMRAWMMAHVYGAEYQAVVCMCGSAGEAAFRESLYPQYTSPHHDAKGLCTYYITGTSGDATISRIVPQRMEKDVPGAPGGPLRVKVTSNTHAWRGAEFYENESLVSLELNVERLVVMESSFLYGCSRLEHIDLSPLGKVEVLPDNFLTECNALRTINLHPLVRVREIGINFLSGCVGLKTINLSALRDVEVLPMGFLIGCTNLEVLDLNPLVNLKQIDHFFLHWCISLLHIKWSSLEGIHGTLPNHFFSTCKSLKSVDLTPLRNVRVLGERFLNGCAGLTSIDLRPLAVVEVIQRGFLQGCRGLKEVDFSPLTNLRDVDKCILEACKSLECIRIAENHSIKMIPTDLRDIVVIWEEVGGPEPSSVA